jgi:hypothetical protein
MGGRSKLCHLAHLFCDVFVMVQVVKKTRDMGFHLPLSQAQLADVLGLSVVHMNRVIGTLRRQNVISWTGHMITILDWERLVTIAEFDPTYLSMAHEPR